MGGKTTGNVDRPAAPDESHLVSQRQRARKRAVRNCGALTVDNVHKVLNHERYWTKVFVEVYLDRCDHQILDDPSATAVFAELAPRLVERIRIGEHLEELPSIAERSSWWLRAQGLRADARRVRGDAAGAGEALAEAYAHCSRQRVRRQALAELHRRRALWLAATDPAEAGRFLDASIDLGRGLGPWPRRGEAHLARAWLGMRGHPPSGLVDLAQAMALSNPRRPRSSVVFGLALDRLWRVLAEVPSLAVDEEPAALNAIHQAQRRFFGHSTKSVAKTMLYWIEALLTRRLGVARHTERRLRLASDAFVVLGAEVEAFLVQLDLAHFLFEQGPVDHAAERLAAASRFAERSGERPTAVFKKARAALGEADAFRAVRRAACDLLPRAHSPAVLLPSPPLGGADPSRLGRARDGLRDRGRSCRD